MDAQAVGAQADAVVRGHPVGQLGRRPGARPCGHLGTDGGEHGRGQRRLFAATRFIGQGGKAFIQESFDPRADGLLVLAEVACNPGHAPAGVREAHHLQPIAGTGGHPRLAGALAKLLALFVRQSDTVHTHENTESYEL